MPELFPDKVNHAWQVRKEEFQHASFSKHNEEFWLHSSGRWH